MLSSHGGHADAQASWWWPMPATDTLSVIDTRYDQVIDTISMHWQPSDFFGASPNALAFDETGRNLYVCNGTQNACGGAGFSGHPDATWKAYSDRLVSGRDCLWTRSAKRSTSPTSKASAPANCSKPGEKVKFNSHQYLGTLSLVRAHQERDGR